MVRRRPRPHYFINAGLSIAVLAVFALTGVRVAGNTSAATANPYGYADYCTLESNTTVIYGWAADPDASSLTQPSVTISAGGKAVTAASNRANYRDTYINNWISQNRSGDPRPGSYGFRAQIAGLIKGSYNKISGTVLNEGAGDSVILSINNNSFTDGDGTKPFFAGNVIPDECLAAPAPVPNTATPNPTPTPPSVKPNPGTAPIVTNTTDAVVTSGTLAAEVKIPAGTAKSVKVSYGKNPIDLDLESSEVRTNGAETVIMLTGLESATTYNFQIIRTDAKGKQTAAPITKFDTLGFIISLHFVDKQNIGIQGIPASISAQDKLKTSNDIGDMQFIAVPAGKHTIAYSYRDIRYTKDIAANAATVKPAESSTASVVTLDFTINVEEAVGADLAASTGGGSPAVAVIVLLVIGLIILGFSAYIFKLSRPRLPRLPRKSAAIDEPAPPLPDHYTTLAPPESTGMIPKMAPHMGESLKDMVVHSMQDEARRRNHPDDPENR